MRTFSPSDVNRSAVRLARDRGGGTLRVHRLSFSAPARPSPPAGALLSGPMSPRQRPSSSATPWPGGAWIDLFAPAQRYRTRGPNRDVRPGLLWLLLIAGPALNLAHDPRLDTAHVHA